MKKGIIVVIVILSVIILAFLGMLLWKKNEIFYTEIFKEEYKETFIGPDNWINEETLNNKVSIKNTRNFDIAIRITFEEKILDNDNNEFHEENINIEELFDKKIYDENWVKVDGDKEYYYYSYGLAKGEEINLSQYLFLNNRDNIDSELFDGKKYSINTIIEFIEYDSYIEGWNLVNDNNEKIVNIKKPLSNKDKIKLDEEMKMKEETMLFNDKIDRKLNSLTLEEKIGQMMIISLSKNDKRLSNEGINYNIDKLLNDVKPGGVIVETSDFKARNVAEMIELTKKIKDSSSIPIIISVDQEGGRVQRFNSLKDRYSNDITYIPAMSKIGNTNDKDIAYDTGKLIGMELNALGFNMDFAPVMDTLYIDSNVIGDRSFGSNPELVTKMGLAVANGLQERGIIPVYKHFPNHGSTSTDSHDGLPEVNKTKEELLVKDLIPFKEAINSNAPVMMVGHLYYPEITDVPSSLSKEIITDLLKNEMGFKGLVITDSLRMGAIINKYGEKEIYEMAINAGVDILLMPYNPDYAVNYIKESIENGKITEEQINNSVRKILTLKYSSMSTNDGDKNILNSSQYEELSKKISQIK